MIYTHMNKKNIISNIINGSPNRLREKYFIKYNKDVYDDIILYTQNINDLQFKWKVWHWVNNKPDYILCKCGNRVSTHISYEEGYRKFCSYKCSSNDEELRENTKSTLIKRYGVSHYSKTDEYKSKVKKTSLEKYGSTNYSKTDEYKKKSKKTYLDRYGVDSYTKTDEYKEKSKKTCLDKYGVDSYTKTDECKNLIKSSLYKRIGQDMVFKDIQYRKDNFEISNNDFYLEYLGNSISEFKCDFGLEHTFSISTDNYYGRKHSNNKLCTICNPISSLSSIKEDMLYNFILENYKGKIIKNYKDQFEIDIYLPELSIGIEFNGIYYHSDKFKEKNYHISKSNFFKNKLIHIFHIWEDDWTYHNDIVKSQILNLLSLTKNKIYARNCDVREVNIVDSRKFLNNNHIQGFVKSNIKIGLYYNEELVSFMSFDHYEGRNKIGDTEWNLNRFCSLLRTNVVGGASKLLSYFIKNTKVSRIVSYADKDWSSGTLYNKLGFELVSETSADYKYIIGDKRIHKSRYRKSRLVKSKMTEYQIMKSSDINRIYDCGKLKFEKIF